MACGHTTYMLLKAGGFTPSWCGLMTRLCLRHFPTCSMPVILQGSATPSASPRLLQDYTKPGAIVAYFGLFAVHWVYFLIVQQLKRLKDRSFPVEALDKDAQQQALKSE